MNPERFNPNDDTIAKDASTIESAAGGPIDIAIVLGSGLSNALAAHADFTSITFDGRARPLCLPSESDCRLDRVLPHAP